MLLLCTNAVVAAKDAGKTGVWTAWRDEKAVYVLDGWILPLVGGGNKRAGVSVLRRTGTLMRLRSELCLAGASSVSPAELVTVIWLNRQVQRRKCRKRPSLFDNFKPCDTKTR